MDEKCRHFNEEGFFCEITGDDCYDEIFCVPIVDHVKENCDFCEILKEKG